MAQCNIIPIASKACSGKCRGGSCASAPRVWVVAACGGMISLFEKGMSGVLTPMTQDGNAVFASLDAFQKSIDDAEHAHAFDQLVVVGSSSDIAWVHASLPQPAMHHIAAEIEYPLLPAWLRLRRPL